MSTKPVSRSSRAPDDALIKLRRERKRTTDRAAQREHRRRQKLYVEELEAQLARVREGAVNEQVARLMVENERLQKELNKYRAFFESVEDLVMEEWQHDNKKKNENASDTVNDDDNTDINNDAAANNNNPQRQSPASQPPAIESRLTPQASTSPNVAVTATPDAIEHDGQPPPTFPVREPRLPPMAEHPDVALAEGTAGMPGEVRSWTHMSPPGAFDWSVSAFGLDSAQHVQTQLGTHAPALLWDETAGSIDGSNHSLMVDTTPRPFIAGNSTQAPNSQENMALSLPFPNLFSQHLNELDPAFIFGPPKQAGPLLHQLLPRILEPQNAEDQHIQVIIERARTHNIRLDSPTLADFLCDNPDNVLSAAIKHYLEPVRRSRRTIEFLATYWVLYLLLRWQINRDEESYYNVPTWLRPTVTQTRVHHPIATDLLAWPLLRDETIMRSLNGSDVSREILADIGLNLEVDIPLHKFSLNHDVTFLHTAISDLNNWRLNEGFFRKHPSLRVLYESSFSHQS